MLSGGALLGDESFVGSRADVIYFPGVRIPLLTRLLSPRRERAERCVSIYPITGLKYECVYAVVCYSLLPRISTGLTRHSRAVGTVMMRGNAQ